MIPASPDMPKTNLFGAVYALTASLACQRQTWLAASQQGARCARANLGRRAVGSHFAFDALGHIACDRDRTEYLARIGRAVHTTRSRSGGFRLLQAPSAIRIGYGLRKLHLANGQTLTALCEHKDMTRQAVTQHLQLLEEANLVVIVWQGREKLHYLNPVLLHEICARWIEKFEHHRLGALRILKKRREGDDDEKA